MATLTKDEAQLLSVHRAILDFNRPDLIDTTDVGHILEGLKEIVDLDTKETELDGKGLKALIYGFVAGIAVTRLANITQQYGDWQSAPEDPYPEGEFVGGSSSGVALQQGQDPNFVTQTGPKGAEKVK